MLVPLLELDPEPSGVSIVAGGVSAVSFRLGRETQVPSEADECQDHQGRNQPARLHKGSC